MKHGILSVALLSDREDGEAFNLLLNQLCDEYEPVGVREHIQVQRIAAALWRLRRALEYESQNSYDSFHQTVRYDFGRTLRYETHAEKTLDIATRELHRLQSERKARELEGRDVPLGQEHEKLEAQ